MNQEESTYDAELKLTAPAWQHMWRPEFDVTPAFNARSILLPVARIEGVTWGVIAPHAADSLIVGQGSAVTLDGRFDADFAGSKSLFVNWGSAAHDASGGSRAAQYMLFDQAIREVREPATAGNGALLLPEGRTVLKGYLAGGRVVFFVERASDIREVVRYAKAHGMKPVIAGGDRSLGRREGARRGRRAGRSSIRSIICRADFDRLGSRFDNAKLLNEAGVRIAFSFSDSFQARKNRQLAGQRRRARTALGSGTRGDHVEPSRDFRHRQGSRPHREGPGRGSRAVERRSARGHDGRGAGLDRRQCGHDALAPDGIAGQDTSNA